MSDTPTIDVLVLVPVVKPVYTEDDLAPYSIWMHVATRSIYTVLVVGLCSTNGDREHKERSVVYWSHTHQHECYREVSEFLDGRFVPVVC